MKEGLYGDYAHQSATSVPGTVCTAPFSKERMRFLPAGIGLVYLLRNTLAEQDFWLRDLTRMRSRRLTRLSSPAIMRTFDITPDGNRILFDRSREDSEIQLIDLVTN